MDVWVVAEVKSARPRRWEATAKMLPRPQLHGHFNSDIKPNCLFIIFFLTSDLDKQKIVISL